jgi:phenylalanyl-tRNA synthetase beta chain
MYASYDWLKDYIEIEDGPVALAAKLTMVGVEAEVISQYSALLESVVISRVESVEKHPDADKLSVCKVSDGKNEYDVVCGAPNVAAGQLVPLALPKTVLPDGMKVKKAKIRGVKSFGMLCSEKELGISDDQSGIMVLPEDAPLGESIVSYLSGTDARLEVSLTPNRPDCLSHIGLAREIAASQQSKVRLPSFSISEAAEDVHTMAGVVIEDKDLCPRYAARLVRDVVIGPSPDWMVKKLNAVGIRSINNVVDITNFVLMEFGQPLHAFDFSRIRGRKIIVRRAKEDETLTTLDGIERKLEPDDLLIADEGGGIALAGIMGGSESEVTEATKDILIESAYFTPSAIRRTSKRLGMHTEASHRFERGVDPVGIITALDRAASLMAKLAGGKVLKGAIDEGKRKWEKPQITVRTDRTNRLLGTKLNKSEIGDLLRQLGLEIIGAGDDLVCEPPTFRVDLSREIDIIEEVARIYGYDNIEATSPVAPISAPVTTPEDAITEIIRNFCVNRGYYEVINYSFEAEDTLAKLNLVKPGKKPRQVKMLNPVAETAGVLRTSLIPGLLRTLVFNLNRQSTDIRLFEFGHVFSPAETTDVLPHEENIFGIIFSGRRNPENWASSDEKIDFYDMKGFVEDLFEKMGIEAVFKKAEGVGLYSSGAAATIESGKHLLGLIGQVDEEIAQSLDINQQVIVAELRMNALVKLYGAVPKYKPIPQFPRSLRDLAFVLDRQIEVRDVIDAIEEKNIKHLESIKVVDLYQGKNIPKDKNSLALRFSFRSKTKTLTDAEVDKQTVILTEVMKSKFEAELRK